MDSLRLVIACHKHGLLSKEAMVDVLRKRDQLIKQALQKEAASIFSRMGRTISPTNPQGLVGGIVHRLKKGSMTGGGQAGSSWSDVVSNVGKLTALAGLTAGAGAGIHGLIRHSRDKRLNTEIQNSYTQMFTEHPILNSLKEENPHRVQRNFGVLAQYAPSLAANPAVAGSFVTQMARTDHIGPEIIKGLADTQMVIDKREEMHSPVRGKWQEGLGLARSAIGG